MSRHAILAVACAALVGVPTPATSQQTSSGAARPVVVASKPFAESYLLAEVFAQQLEARGHAVVRRFGLGGTDISFPALQQGSIDVYPEYTGAGLLTILKAPPDSNPATVSISSRANSEHGSTSTGCRRSGSRTPTPCRCGPRRPSASGFGP